MPDPDDPDAVLRKKEAEEKEKKVREGEEVVDERLDPYSGRWRPREARTERLAEVVGNERVVEGIVRARTWAVLGERCADVGASGEGAEEAFERWRREQRGEGK